MLQKVCFFSAWSWKGSHIYSETYWIVKPWIKEIVDRSSVRAVRWSTWKTNKVVAIYFMALFRFHTVSWMKIYKIFLLWANENFNVSAGFINKNLKKSMFHRKDSYSSYNSNEGQNYLHSAQTDTNIFGLYKKYVLSVSLQTYIRIRETYNPFFKHELVFSFFWQTIVSNQEAHKKCRVYPYFL